MMNDVANSNSEAKKTTITNYSNFGSYSLTLKKTRNRRIICFGCGIPQMGLVFVSSISIIDLGYPVNIYPRFYSNQFCKSVAEKGFTKSAL